MDFVHDQLATGTKLRVLTIVDTFSRFSPAIEPRFNFRGADVVEVLERIPESLLPLLACSFILPLTIADILIGTVLFVVGELLLSRPLFKLHVRDRP
jgi:hypothetical protein